jgi:hypothetical protein
MSGGLVTGPFQGQNNTALGNGTLSSETTVTGAIDNNTAIGNGAINNITAGVDNTAVGFQALYYLTGGSRNTLLGSGAGGDGNTNPQRLIGGDNNILIGYNTDLNVGTTGSNILNIGNSIFGTGINTTTNTPTAGNITDGKIGINVRQPAATLDVNGDARVRNLPLGAVTDSIVTADANGNLRKLGTAVNWFYLPSFNLDVSTTGAKTVNLYDVYSQFAQSGNTSFVVSAGTTLTTPATATNLPLYTATQLAYIVTYYDNTVINNVSINANGLMSYNVLSTTIGPNSYLNIVCLIK